MDFCSSCPVQSDKLLPFKDLSFPKKNIYTKKIAKINDQMFVVKIRNIFDKRNKRKKIRTSSNSAIFFIKIIELFICNQWEIADFWVYSQVLWFWCRFGGYIEIDELLKQISGNLIPNLIIQDFKLWKISKKQRTKELGTFLQIWESGKEKKESLIYYRLIYWLISNFPE